MSLLFNRAQVHIFMLISFLIGICNSYGQDIPSKNEVNIQSTKEADTTTISITGPVTPINEVVQDTIKPDTVQPKPEMLDDVVDYYGEDYVYIDRKNNKVYMYNQAYIVYGDMRIDAGLIILDLNNNEVSAKGIDSAGVYSQRPIFEQATNIAEPDSLRFNTETKKAIVYNTRTEQDGIITIAETTKKENDSVYFLRKVKFTTSKNLEDPEYYFYTRKAKFVPKKKVVTGLTNMYIADVPTPIGLPFAFFPLTEDRTSGFIIPTIGDDNSRGFFFQNGGYYFAINDYVDLTVLGDYYTNGSYGLRGESSYSLRYKFNGNVSVRYENLLNSERGFPDFSQSSVYNIRWNHTQDAKSNPTSRFSASVNLGSSRYFRQSINQVNNASALVNTLSSSVSYDKTFEGEPQVNITIAGTHQQNTNTQEINMSLPNLNASVSRIFPFAPKSGVKKGILQNINFQYDLSAENRISTVDSLFFKSEMFDDAQIGARHSIPVSTNFKILDYLSASMSTGVQETWTLQTTSESYDPDANEGSGAVVRDTLQGFDRYLTYNFSTSLGTTLYGMYDFEKEGEDKKIKAIRHVMRPSISYNINPGFDQYYEDYNIPSADPEVNDQVVSYSRFQNTLFGAPGRDFSSSIGVSLSNTLEAKVRDKDTTATEPRKIVLLNNLNFNTAYNLSADSLNLSPVRFTGSIPIVKKLDFNFNGSLDPYALDNNNNRIDEFNIDNGGSLFRLTNANVSFNYSFSSRDFEGDGDDDPDINDETFRNGGRPDDLFGDATSLNERATAITRDEETDRERNVDWYNFSIPWDLRVAYTMTYANNRRQSEISSQSIMFSSNLELSPRWSVGISSGYDFKNKGVTLTQLRFVRDLESWELRFNWTPIGSINTNWYFFIGIRSGVLSDIKYDQRRVPDRNL
ncbi:MAG: LPS-assembly protein LptD [Bacteroidia bacterium]|nr:LPS-assembly protein LptD [Bacteroidia bacterium]MBT8277070.1 LPS-assembly protein LptD [Bacteroidia bacterium]NNF32057.1 LPS-assembly protein LptD [Flavobacteriaceae bacterium]NNK52978.1 LPS-assembly protein LptD [Flavobacteriaceae bacterium]NNM07793.1 LPS-assembly protein LptD [Flavobacteriaceae bacterium]